MVIVAVEVLQRPLPWNTGFSTESDWKVVLERNSVSFNRLKSAYLNRNSTFGSFRFPTLFREALIKANLDWFGLISSGSKFLSHVRLQRSQYQNCCSDYRNKPVFSCNLPFLFAWYRRCVTICWGDVSRRNGWQAPRNFARDVVESGTWVSSRSSFPQLLSKRFCSLRFVLLWAIFVQLITW